MASFSEVNPRIKAQRLAVQRTVYRA